MITSRRAVSNVYQSWCSCGYHSYRSIDPLSHLMTPRDLIAQLSALPEDQKDLPLVFETVITVSQEVEDIKLGAAAYGQQITLSGD
jgi:hypothetical protein